jgi:diaminopimelate decarboxylase
MSFFNYQDNRLFAEKVDLSTLAKEVGTPAYVYSQTAMTSQWKAFDAALAPIPHTICYAVKANSNLSVLKVLADVGAGFDIVSQGELERVLKAGGEPGKVVFSGVAKTHAEIERALEVGILAFNIESLPELERIAEIAEKRGVQAPVILRINPNVDAKTHPYIATGLKENKFGIAHDEVFTMCELAQHLPSINFLGIGCHIGSQLLDLAPFFEALDKVLSWVAELQSRNIPIRYLNLGGGLGVSYHNETPPSITEYAAGLLKKLAASSVHIIIEPGRSIVANAGVLLTRVEYIKHTPAKEFLIVDVGMNDLLRPALYQAWHDIEPVIKNKEVTEATYDIVGPVCETADFLAKNRTLAVAAGDLLAIKSAGAYGFTMSSHYNSRPRAVEVMVSGADYRVIRRRETYDDLYLQEVECLKK